VRLGAFARAVFCRPVNEMTMLLFTNERPVGCRAPIITRTSHMDPRTRLSANLITVAAQKVCDCLIFGHCTYGYAFLISPTVGTLSTQGTHEPVFRPASAAREVSPFSYNGIGEMNPFLGNREWQGRYGGHGEHLVVGRFSICGARRVW
jgi:hypothetical protein